MHMSTASVWHHSQWIIQNVEVEYDKADTTGSCVYQKFSLSLQCSSLFPRVHVKVPQKQNQIWLESKSRTHVPQVWVLYLLTFSQFNTCVSRTDSKHHCNIDWLIEHGLTSAPTQHTVNPRIEAPGFYHGGFYQYNLPWPQPVSGIRHLSGTRLLSGIYGRLYGWRFLHIWWPNQQCQSTEGGWLVIQTGLSLTRLTSPCYNNTTCMQI